MRVEDVVIIGGGPGGSALAGYLAKAGVSVTLFESAIHPRPHVGESMVPSTTIVLRELGFLETIENEKFIRKYGATWHPITRSEELSIIFKEFPQEGIDQDYTWHVDRARFDGLLLKHASNLGATVYQGTEVKRVLMEDGRAVGVEVAVAGQLITVRARYVLDASGRKAILGRQLGMYKKDPLFNQFATGAWFKNVNRSRVGRENDIHIYFLPNKRAWAWQIPISDEITSVGIVVEKDDFRKIKGDVDGWFTKMIASTPDFGAAMESAVRVSDYNLNGDYSYSMERFAGPGYMLVGDAARFVDPIFSSGISVALFSAKFAAEELTRVLKEPEHEVEAFTRYEARMREGCDIWYEFIGLYYKLLPLFTLFVRRKKYRNQIMALLQGVVFDRSTVPVLDVMREFIEAVESNEQHLLRPFLGELDMSLIDELRESMAARA